jgi:hypothetical protein
VKRDDEVKARALTVKRAADGGGIDADGLRLCNLR